MKEIVTMNLLVGNDNGNSEQDLIINGDHIQQPNVYTKVRALPNFDDVVETDIINNISDNLVVTVSSPSCEKSTYYVGQYARKSGKKLNNIEVGAFNSKVDSSVPVVNTLAHIAGYAVKKAEEKINGVEDIEVSVDMVTALPVLQYSKGNARKFANKFLNGAHLVQVHVSKRVINVRIVFQYVKVLPESVPTVFYLQSLKHGHPILKEFNERYGINVDGKFFQNKRILHVAIGEGTTEYPLTEDMLYNLNFVEGSNNGVGHAIERVVKDFMKEKFLQKFSRQDYSDILRNPAHKYYKDALDFIDVELEAEAEEIMRHVREEVGRANNEIDIIAIYGGGSILMRKFLANKAIKLVEDVESMILYVPESEAVEIEVKGMYNFASSSIFAKLKQKSAEIEIK